MKQSSERSKRKGQGGRKDSSPMVKGVGLENALFGRPLFFKTYLHNNDSELRTTMNKIN